MNTINDETIREWVILMYERELEDTKADISNNRIWALGYDGPPPNPHYENLELLENYYEFLQETINELKFERSKNYDRNRYSQKS